MISFPPCKINLGLAVLAKRSDGFHDIETCFYPVSRTDILEIISSKDFSFTQSGLRVDGDPEDNLCVKAFKLVQREFGISSVKIHLHKMIPIGAGLGGGSSNAAFVLKMLNDIFQLNAATDQLKKLAAQLGSDCVFFLENKPMIGTGRGELLAPAVVDLHGKYLVLVKPDIHVSTAEAYSNIQPQKPERSVQEILQLPLKEWKGKLTNDFELSIFRKYPAIHQVKEKLYTLGATYASMSGSGASVFGLFEKPGDFKNEFATMDYWSGELK